jgi:hypothetical protein
MNFIGQEKCSIGNKRSHQEENIFEDPLQNKALVRNL